MPEAPGFASSIYIASPEGDTGKSTIALGILHRLTATVPKVGVFRPITRLGEERDYILELLLSLRGLCGRRVPRAARRP